MGLLTGVFNNSFNKIRVNEIDSRGASSIIIKKPLVFKGTQKVMTGNDTFAQTDSNIIFITADGAYNVDPTGTFSDYYKVEIVNYGATTLTFDSTGSAQTIVGGARGVFIYRLGVDTWY